jgi:hypothetical protein
MDYEFWILSIAIAGIIVAYMNIRKAMLLGISATWLSLLLFFFYLTSYIQDKKYFVKELLKYNGFVTATLIVLAWYIHLVWKNEDYITENKMPDNWYLFSYFVLVALTGIISCIYFYLKQPSATLNVIAWILFFTLLGFVIIETIIGTYYRTDGFLV